MERQSIKEILTNKSYHPGFSVDCVVLGFHEGTLKILLCKLNSCEYWMLPGGFVRNDENVDDAAHRHLYTRTGVKNLYLKQFHLFGDTDRIDINQNKQILAVTNIPEKETEWFLRRFVSVAYYALVEYSKVEIGTDPDIEKVEWFDVSEIPELYCDHNKIVLKARDTIRVQLGYVPVGYELLPEKFTMPELRTIYETIEGEALDRRNFQRKMLSIGLIRKLNETRKVGAHKSPILYEFNKEKYDNALKNGLRLMDYK